MTENTKAWLKGLIAAVVAGASTAGVSWMSMAMAKSVGVDVPTLNFKALGMILLVAALANLFTYLKQSPLPLPAKHFQRRRYQRRPDKLPSAQNENVNGG